MRLKRLENLDTQKDVKHPGIVTFLIVIATMALVAAVGWVLGGQLI